MHFVMHASSNHVAILHNVKRNVGADLHIRPNIPYLYHSNCLAPSNLRKPLATRCVRTNQFIHFVYGNQNQVAQAVLLVQNGTLGRAGIFNYGLFDIR